MPIIGDFGCVNDEDMLDLPEELLQDLKIEDSGCFLKPQQLEKLVFDHAIVKSETEMRLLESQYVTIRWPKAALIADGEPTKVSVLATATPCVQQVASASQDVAEVEL